MVNFDKLLGDALAGPSPAASVADADLNEIVAAASAAITRQVRDAELRITAVRTGADGILYALALLAGQGGKQGPVIEGILVSSNGYPIAVGGLLTLPGGVMVLEPGTRRDLADKTALEEHFALLLSSTASPVLQQVAFLKRSSRP